MPAQDGTYQSSYGQNFQTGINTPAGNTARPDFAYQKYYDDVNNRWRAFRNKAEAHAWIPTPKIGQLRMIQVGYSSLTNGVYTGGLETPFIYIGGITVDNLVELKIGTDEIYFEVKCDSDNTNSFTPPFTLPAATTIYHFRPLYLNQTPIFGGSTVDLISGKLVIKNGVNNEDGNGIIRGYLFKGTVQTYLLPVIPSSNIYGTAEYGTAEYKS